MKTSIQKTLLGTALALSIAALLGVSNIAQAQALGSYVSPEQIAFESKKTEELAAAQDLKIVYFGSDQFKSEMRARGAAGTDRDDFAAKSGVALDEFASDQIVIVESANRDQALFERLLARGNVIISIGSSLNAAGHAWKSVFNRDAGLREAGNPAKTLAPTNKVTGYRFSPYGSGRFSTDESNEALAIAETILWARDAVAREETLVSQHLSKATSSYSDSNSETCKNIPIAGRVNTSYVFEKKSDTSSSKDYWTVTLGIQAIPGASSRIGKYANRFSSSNMIDSDPQSTVAGRNGSVTLAASGVSGSWTYQNPGLTIRSLGNLSSDEGKWEHTFGRYVSAAQTSFTIKPGVLLEVTQGLLPYWFSHVSVTFYGRSLIPGSTQCVIAHQSE